MNNLRTWPGLIQAYLQSLQAVGRSKGTIRLHRYYLQKIRGCAPCPALVTRESLEHTMAQPTWAPETRKSIRAVAKGFFTYAEAIGAIKTNPAATLASVNVPPGVPRPAPDEVIAEALSQADERTALMILFGAYCGLRCAEIAQIHARDWDGQLLIINGKGGKRRLVPVIQPRLRLALNQATGYLFPGKTEGHLSAGHVTKLLSAALPKGITGHQLRHRFATTAYQATRDLLAVGQVLGHAKPETTKRYCQVPHDSLLAVVRAAS